MVDLGARAHLCSQMFLAFQFTHSTSCLQDSGGRTNDDSIMADIDLITKRRSEVLKIIEEAQKALADGQAELAELDVAGKTLARLTGGEWPPAGQKDAGIAQVSGTSWIKFVAHAKGRTLNVTDMLLSVLADAKEQGLPGLPPKEARTAIREKFDFDVRGEYMSTTMWRLAEKKKLVRVGDGLYALPENEVGVFG